MTALTIHGVTLSQGATAELLYLADVPITVDADKTLHVDEPAAIAAIDQALTARRDDLKRVAAECYQLLDLEFGARKYWSYCFIVAARLCGGSL
jgi:hypothetical protein